MLTELGGSQVEERCSLSSEGPRLRSSGAQCAQTLAVEIHWCHCVRKLAKSLAKSWQGGSGHGSGGRGGGGEGGGGEGGGGGEEQLWIKSSNPHLAGGEIYMNININIKHKYK